MRKKKIGSAKDWLGMGLQTLTCNAQQQLGNLLGDQSKLHCKPKKDSKISNLLIFKKS